MNIVDQKRAREIMGKNFFGIDEAVKYYGVNPTQQQLVALSKIPFSETVLEELKDTHVLVADFGLSIQDIINNPKINNPRVITRHILFFSHAPSSYFKQVFMKQHSEVSWRLVRKTPVVSSMAKTWSEQQRLLGKDDEVPTARVITYTIIGHYLANNEEYRERLFLEGHVRTSSLDLNGSHVDVGGFDFDGLYFSSGEFCHNNVGLASARKVQF